MKSTDSAEVTLFIVLNTVSLQLFVYWNFTLLHSWQTDKSISKSGPHNDCTTELSAGRLDIPRVQAYHKRKNIFLFSFTVSIL